MITSGEIVFRRLTSSDLDVMIEMKTDDQMMRYTSFGRAQSVEDIKKNLNKCIDDESKDHPLGVWGTELKSSGDFLGWFMLKKERHPFAELGYMIRKKYWGKGLTTKSVQLLLDYGFSINLQKICAVTDPENKASIRVLEKTGFLFVEDREVQEKDKKVILKYFEVSKLGKQD